MNRQTLISQIGVKNSFLCVGLDSDIDKLPVGFNKDLEGLVSFNAAIIEATKDHCVAYKVNTAFYERYGSGGWDALEKTRALLPSSHFLIADAKRADIGNTTHQYALAFFEQLDFDAVTVAPYMGRDSVEPFLNYPGKWTILLAITSNPGSMDFQLLTDAEGIPIYARVAQKAVSWADPEQLMFVCGATRPEQLEFMRKTAPDHFFLVPGVGAQGGSLEEVCNKCMTDDVGILVNSSRSIIYASSGPDFQSAAARKAEQLQKEMASILLK